MGSQSEVAAPPFSFDYIADTIGRSFETGSKNVAEKGKVVGPYGVTVPLEWRFSHGRSSTTNDYDLLCWKVTGGLYISVAFEPKTKTTTVILMNKAKLPKEAKNLISMANWNNAPTLDEYVQRFKPMIVGVWARNNQDSAYTKVAI